MGCGDMMAYTGSKKEFWKKAPTVKCPYCGKKYKHRRFLRLHLANKHDLGFMEAGRKVIEIYKKIGVNLVIEMIERGDG